MFNRARTAVCRVTNFNLTQTRFTLTGHNRVNSLRESSCIPPTSILPMFRNQFDQADHPSLWAEDSKRQVQFKDVNPITDIIHVNEFSNQPHQTTGVFSRQPRYNHYHHVYEPVFVPTPDLSQGHLAVGPSVTRTSVWATPDEPAIQSVARFTPDNFRPIGYAENAPSPTTASPYHDFDEARLPLWHADRRPFTYLLSATTAFVTASVVRAFLVETVAMLLPRRTASMTDYIEVELGAIGVGESAMIRWKGKPIFITHRTPEQIYSAKLLDSKFDNMRDPELDSDRTFKDEWIVCVAVCTHLGCIPTTGGNYGGFYCSCHGSHYDASGRIWQGPASLNLPVPPHRHISDDIILIG